MNLDDTIVAIATPPGRGGIGVVRLAGTEARAIALTMLRLQQEIKAGHSIFGELVDTQDKSTNRIDEVVVTYFAKPHSYTTDDIVEISAHGSPVVLAHIVELALTRGARLAEPGEFTMRADSGRSRPRSDRIADAISGKGRCSTVGRRTFPTLATNQTKIGEPDRNPRSWS